MRDTVFTRHSVRIAEVDGEIVGFASRDGSWLMNLYVKPGWTGHGIGSQLLRAMLANAASATPVLRVCTFARNERVRRFFERNGFTRGRPPVTASATRNTSPTSATSARRGRDAGFSADALWRDRLGASRELQLPARQLELVAQPLAQRGERRPIAHARRIHEVVGVRGLVRDR